MVVRVAFSQQADPVDVVVIGAGQAGLSTAYFLRRFGFEPGRRLIVLDAAEGPGGAWRHRPRTLTMAKVHGIFDLPGLPRRTDTGDDARPAAEVVPAYFAEYERRFELQVRRPVRVRSVDRDAGRFLVMTDQSAWRARAIVNATGSWERPYLPYYPDIEDFAGRRLHSADYRGPEDFAGLSVVVVGAGHSALQVLAEIADHAASVAWVTRRPPVFRQERFSPEFGRRVVAEVDRRVRAGLPPQSVASVTGITPTPVVDEARAKGVLHPLPIFDRIAPEGVAWSDGRFVRADVIIWATGFRAALDHLAPLRLREPGGGIRMDGTRVVAEPRVHLVGYGPSASTIGANRAGRAAAREIRELLAAEPAA